MDNIMKEGQSMMDSGNSNNSSNQSSDIQSSGSDKSSGGSMMDSMKQKGENAYMKNEVNDMMDKAGVPEGMDSKIDGLIDGGMKKF